MNHAISFEAAKAEDYQQIKVDSSAFSQNGMIPSKYTCDGMNTNPPLTLENIPQKAKSLAIIIEDPDASNGTWTHWAMWNIPVTHHIKEGHDHGMQGVNDFKNHGYGGPCPPSGTHRYYFKIYALDCQLRLSADSGKKQLEKAISNHIIGFGILIGKYDRHTSS